MSTLRQRKPSTTLVKPIALNSISLLQQPFIRISILSLILTTTIGTIISLKSSSSLIDIRSRTPIELLNSSTEFGILNGLSYFKDKRNVVNQLMVKFAWGWTTLLFSIYVFTSYNFPVSKVGTLQASTQHKINLLTKQIKRWILSTIYWYYLTQQTWFLSLGPSISHYILLATGAECIPHKSNGSSSAGITGDGNLFSQSMVGGVCEPGFGRYRGGHDISGHTFILVHASLFLLSTISTSLPILFPSIHNLFAPPLPNSSKSILSLPQKLSVYSVLVLLSVWWFMLLNTSLFFHHWSEKLSGFIFGLGGWLFSGL